MISRPSRSTIEIKVGLNKDGSKRVELRHISDIKVAYLRQDAVIATRPKRGRPPKANPSSLPEPDASSLVDFSSNQNKPANIDSSGSPNLEDDPPFHGFATQTAQIDFSRPPPLFPRAGNSNAKSTPADAWVASPEEITNINYQITRRRGSWVSDNNPSRKHVVYLQSAEEWDRNW